MSISIIVAMARNRAIGINNRLPWRLSDDLKLFKKNTMGHAIVMGRKTWESIGRPLPGRENIILTRNTNFQAAGCLVVHSLEEILTAKKQDDECFIIGGATLYAAALPLAQKLYLTQVEAAIEGDVFFPEFDENQWQEINRQHFVKNDKNEFEFTFRVLQRKAQAG